MPWVKIDDGFYNNPTNRRIGPAGRDLFVASDDLLTYCRAHPDDTRAAAVLIETQADVIAELTGLRDAIDVVNEQADDSDLWLGATSIEYVQKALHRLHLAVLHG